MEQLCWSPFCGPPWDHLAQRASTFPISKVNYPLHVCNGCLLSKEIICSLKAGTFLAQLIDSLIEATKFTSIAYPWTHRTMTLKNALWTAILRFLFTRMVIVTDLSYFPAAYPWVYLSLWYWCSGGHNFTFEAFKPKYQEWFFSSFTDFQRVRLKKRVLTPALNVEVPQPLKRDNFWAQTLRTTDKTKSFSDQQLKPLSKGHQNSRKHCDKFRLLHGYFFLLCLDTKHQDILKYPYNWLEDSLVLPGDLEIKK